MCGPIFLLVYTLESLGVALAMMGSGRRGKEACTMAFFGLLMTISSMWDLRAPRLLQRQLRVAALTTRIGLPVAMTGSYVVPGGRSWLGRSRVDVVPTGLRSWRDPLRPRSRRRSSRPCRCPSPDRLACRWCRSCLR